MITLRLIFLCLVFVNAVADDSGSIVQTNRQGDVITVDVVLSEEKVVLNATVFKSDTKEVESSVISSPERDVIALPSVSLNNLGDIVVVWQTLNLETKMISIEAVGYASSCGWSEPKIISNDSDFIEAGNYRVQLTERGDIVLFWSRIVPPKMNGVSTNSVLKLANLFE